LDIGVGDYHLSGYWNSGLIFIRIWNSGLIFIWILEFRADIYLDTAIFANPVFI
jgi:hypothetical protein